MTLLLWRNTIPLPSPCYWRPSAAAVPALYFPLGAAFARLVAFEWEGSSLPPLYPVVSLTVHVLPSDRVPVPEHAVADLFAFFSLVVWASVAGCKKMVRRRPTRTMRAPSRPPWRRTRSPPSRRPTAGPRPRGRAAFFQNSRAAGLTGPERCPRGSIRLVPGGRGAAVPRRPRA